MVQTAIMSRGVDYSIDPDQQLSLSLLALQLARQKVGSCSQSVGQLMWEPLFKSYVVQWNSAAGQGEMMQGTRSTALRYGRGVSAGLTYCVLHSSADVGQHNNGPCGHRIDYQVRSYMQHYRAIYPHFDVHT